MPSVVPQTNLPDERFGATSSIRLVTMPAGAEMSGTTKGRLLSQTSELSGTWIVTGPEHVASILVVACVICIGAAAKPEDGTSKTSRAPAEPPSVAVDTRSSGAAPEKVQSASVLVAVLRLTATMFLNSPSSISTCPPVTTQTVFALVML